MRPREKVCAYASTFVRAKGGAARPASVWAGASGSLKLFWNGVEVLSDTAYRGLDADRFGVPIQIEKGYNRLTAKVCGDDDGPMLSLRLANASGAPDPTLEFTSDPQVASEAAKNAVPAQSRPSIPQRVRSKRRQATSSQDRCPPSRRSSLARTPPQVRSKPTPTTSS